MQTTVRKAALLDIVRENRTRHRAVFEAAITGYREEAIRQLDALITQLRAGHNRRVLVSLPLPADHTRDYDRVIRMISLHDGDRLTLTEDDAAMYIQDDWQWKREFLATSSTYAAAAVESNYGEG